MRTLRLHVIPLSNAEKDSTGQYLKPFHVTPQQFKALVDRVNATYASANIRFAFDPDFDWAPMVDTELNTDGPNMRTRGNQMAAAMPGKIVCLLRWGGGNSPTGNGNAYPPPGAGPKPPDVGDVGQDYVALPSQFYEGQYSYLNLGNGSFLAHEFGHYLGLYHTFPGWSDRSGPAPVYGGIPGSDTPTAAQADKAVIDFIAARGGKINALDGDLISDTPPDPSPVLYDAHGQSYCSQPQITVSGQINGASVSFHFSPDTENVMSYFQCNLPSSSTPSPRRLSPQQIQRVENTLQNTSRKALIQSLTFGAHSLHIGGAIARESGQLEVLASDLSGRLWMAHWTQATPGGAWDHWRPVLSPVARPDSPVAVTARDPQKLDIFLAGADGKTYTGAWDRNAANGQWRGWWNILTGAIPAGGTISAVSRDPNKLDIFLVSTDGGVYTAAWDQKVASAQWRGWWRIGNLTAKPGSTVAAVSRDPKKLDIFVAGNDGRTYTAAWDQNVGGSQWRGWWNILTGAIPAGGTISAVSRDPSKLDIFLVSTDGGVYTAAWDQNVANAQWRGWWRIGELVGKPGSPVAAVARDPSKLDIFVAGNDGKTYTAAWDQNMAGAQWRGWWNILTGAISVGGTISAVSRDPGKLDIFLVSIDGAIYTAAWDQNAANAQWRGWWRIGN